MCLAVPGKILKIKDDDPLSCRADVSFGGFVREISLMLVPGASVGDYAVVHAGFAISIIDEDEAGKVIADLEIALGNDSGDDETT